ncbi:MAG TPA: glycosyltransferase, partial [Candidatus Binatia bacterium]|nr:glycosyltransferase [Candidatus Binatia bacterium]
GVGGVRESVVDGETGYVVSPGDVEALGARLRGLLRCPDLRSKMGAAGRARYEAMFTFDRLVAQTTGVYESILARRS